jgi:phosphoribosylformylglycinamidine synthase
LVQLLVELVEFNLIEAAHDISDGGLAIALAEMCAGNKIGAEISTNESLDELFIYSEEKPRIITEARNENIETILNICKKMDIKASIIGSTNSKGTLKFYNRNNMLFNMDVSFLYTIYYNSFKMH